MRRATVKMLSSLIITLVIGSVATYFVLSRYYLESTSRLPGGMNTISSDTRSSRDRDSSSTLSKTMVNISGDGAHLIGTEILGRPTERSVTVNVVALEDLEVYFEYGTKPGVYIGQSLPAAFSGNKPIEVIIDNLQPDTQYYYRMRYHKAGETVFQSRDEHTFHTQRPPGSSFVFTVQSDSHLYDKKCSPDLYRMTLQNELRDGPDFFLDLGDTFGDDHDLGISYSEMVRLHLNQRSYLGIVGHSAPLFLVLGNHEGEGGYNLDGTARNIAVYATQARKLYYPNPFPNSFYSGNVVSEDFVGLPQNYYAWEWGDALFVVLDAYRCVTIDPKVSGNLWDWTLGKAQYDWFKRTLESSHAKYKFVFAHHLLGQTRGAVAFAPYYEWGGHNRDGTIGFDSRRPGWYLPIHQLMVKNCVTIFFQGHDHLFAKEELDNVIYQEVPMPSDATRNIGAPNEDAYLGDVLTNSGHLRVTVSPLGVRVEYIRVFLPVEETVGQTNRMVSYGYTIVPTTNVAASMHILIPPATVSYAMRINGILMLATISDATRIECVRPNRPDDEKSICISRGITCSHIIFPNSRAYAY